MLWIFLFVSLLILVMILFLYQMRKDDKTPRVDISNISLKDIRNSSLDESIFTQGLKDITIESPDFQELKNQLNKKIIGMDEFVNLVILNILIGGHILVEGVPGLAKTKTIKTLSEILDLDFKRMQFTPDMLPSDIVGTEIFNQKTREFDTKLGPIFTNILLADEINRTTPKVQSALLEAMQEKKVSIGGKTFDLPQPFFVLATQNPLEQEGTYPLPEAQIDRFLFKILVDYPNAVQEREILDTIEDEDNIKMKKVLNQTKILKLQSMINSVHISDEIKDYIIRIVQATRNNDARLIYGSSPRGSIGLLLASKSLAFLQGRDYVEYTDVQRLCLSILRHRIVLSYEAKVDGLTQDDVLVDILSQIPLQ